MRKNTDPVAAFEAALKTAGRSSTFDVSSPKVQKAILALAEAYLEERYSSAFGARHDWASKLAQAIGASLRTPQISKVISEIEHENDEELPGDWIRTP